MAGRKANPAERVPPFYCSQTFIAKAFGVSNMSIFNWTKRGCPQNEDGSYSILDVHKWNLNNIKIKFQGSDLSIQKAKKDIELKEAHIQKIRGNFIEKQLMETILASRAGNLRRFLMKTFIEQCIHIVGKSLDETRTVMFDLIQQAMKAYIGDSNG